MGVGSGAWLGQFFINGKEVRIGDRALFNRRHANIIFYSDFFLLWQGKHIETIELKCDFAFRRSFLANESQETAGFNGRAFFFDEFLEKLVIFGAHFCLTLKTSRDTARRDGCVSSRRDA